MMDCTFPQELGVLSMVWGEHRMMIEMSNQISGYEMWRMKWVAWNGRTEMEIADGGGRGVG